MLPFTIHPSRSVPRGVVIERCRAVIVAALCACVFLAPHAAAQRPDSLRILVPPARGEVVQSDSLPPKPPISPKRAFFYSVLAPGYAQSILGRHKAAALILLFEGVAISMIRESAADVAEARRNAIDTVITVGWDGEVARTIRGRFDDEYVRARRSHLEDWIAVLVANHIFAGADAYVAAHLWDVPAELSLRATPGGARVSAKIRW